MNKFDKIRQFIVDNFLYSKPGSLSDEDSFLEKGIVDSTGILELITFLEIEFGVTFADEELVPENFDSISNIRRFLSQKLQETSEVSTHAA